MKITAVRADLESRGILDSRRLLSYATLSATIEGADFQNIAAACFQADRLLLYRANLDNTLGDLLCDCPYSEITDFQRTHRVLYNYVSFSCGGNSFKFFSFDRNVFDQGFRDAGILSE